MSLQFGKIEHLGIVVRNVEKAVKLYEEELGIGPWEIREDAQFFDQMIVNGGHGLNIRSAMFHAEDYEIELIEPTGEGIYKDWLDTHGPGMHHIKFKTPFHYNEVVEAGKRISGRDPYLDVRFPNGNPLVAYADMLEEMGLLVETGVGMPEE